MLLLLTCPHLSSFTLFLCRTFEITKEGKSLLRITLNLKVMAIQYFLVERPNPMDRTAPKKFYAVSKKRGSMGLEGLAERIADATTASKADTILVKSE